MSPGGGEPDLAVLDAMTDDEALAFLQSLPGVGPKTAACVLLFALGRPAMPVDTHVHRVAGRLGLLDPGVTAEAAHGVLTDDGRTGGRPTSTRPTSTWCATGAASATRAGRPATAVR